MHHDWLAVSWFTLIAVLWTGYFFLEGFDFGVGILLPAIGRGDGQRRVVVNSIGPFWDANEVWLIVAGGATFAAFPEWYATMFSGFYLPLFLIIVALIKHPYERKSQPKQGPTVSDHTPRADQENCKVAGRALVYPPPCPPRQGRREQKSWPYLAL